MRQAIDAPYAPPSSHRTADVALIANEERDGDQLVDLAEASVPDLAAAVSGAPRSPTAAWRCRTGTPTRGAQPRVRHAMTLITKARIRLLPHHEAAGLRRWNGDYRVGDPLNGGHRGRAGVSATDPGRQRPRQGMMEPALPGPWTRTASAARGDSSWSCIR